MRADDQVKQATARGLREVKAAVGQQLELAMRDVKDRIEGVRQQVDGVAADHMLEESLVRVECTEQVRRGSRKRWARNRITQM